MKHYDIFLRCKRSTYVFTKADKQNMSLEIITTLWLFTSILLWRLLWGQNLQQGTFNKTWSQPDYFIQHQQKLGVRLVFKNVHYESFQYAIFCIYLQWYSKISPWVRKVTLLQRFTRVVFLILMHISQVSKTPNHGVKYVRLPWSNPWAFMNGWQKYSQRTPYLKDTPVISMFCSPHSISHHINR